MAYNATYVADDVSAISIDLLGTILVAFVGFATLIGLVILIRWFRKRTSGIKI